MRVDLSPKQMIVQKCSRLEKSVQNVTGSADVKRVQRRGMNE